MTTDTRSSVLSYTAQVVKMLITIVILFALCWLPIHIFNFMVWFYPPQVGGSEAKYMTYVFTYFFCHFLSMSHSFINPFVYGFMSENFKVFVIRSLCCKFRKANWILAFGLFDMYAIVCLNPTVEHSLNTNPKHNSLIHWSLLTIKFQISPTVMSIDSIDSMMLRHMSNMSNLSKAPQVLIGRPWPAVRRLLLCAPDCGL